MPEPTPVTDRLEPLPVTLVSECSREMTPEKKEAVREYLTALGPRLRGKYGHRPHYTPPQVHSTAAELALKIDYLCFAYMLYCSPSDFSALHAAAGEACDAIAMRQSVADTFFGGNPDFDAVELADGLLGGLVHVAQTGADVAVTVIQTGAEAAVSLASAGADGLVTVVTSGAGAVADGAGAVFGWLADVDWGGLLDAS